MFVKDNVHACLQNYMHTHLTVTDDKWHGLRALSEQQRKGLEDMVSDLRDMREHEQQLTLWLAQKDRMLDVLGPVAMEPNMLASQMEQVKVNTSCSPFHSYENIYINILSTLTIICLFRLY